MLDTAQSKVTIRDGALPMLVFFGGTFLWAWGLWGYWVFAMPPGGLQFSPGFLTTAILGGFAPSLSALAAAWVTDRGVGLRRAAGRMRDWSLRAGWYIAALAAAPALAAFGYLLQGATLGPLRWPDLLAMLPVLVVWPALAALGEELGWRGFLLPRLEARLGVVASALLIGLVWGLWHLPADYIALKAYGVWFWPAFLVNGPLVLTGHALIMSWLWNRAGPNVPLMVVYHFGITAAAMLAPTAAGGPGAQVAAAALSASLVVLAGAMLHVLAPVRPTPPLR